MISSLFSSKMTGETFCGSGIPYPTSRKCEVRKLRLKFHLVTNGEKFVLNWKMSIKEFLTLFLIQLSSACLPKHLLYFKEYILL